MDVNGSATMRYLRVGVVTRAVEMLGDSGWGNRTSSCKTGTVSHFLVTSVLHRS